MGLGTNFGAKLCFKGIKKISHFPARSQAALGNEIGAQAWLGQFTGPRDIKEAKRSFA
jgi:hypothetical protein